MNRVPLLLDTLRSSFWFLPTVLTLVAAALAIGLLVLDRRVAAPTIRELGWFYTGGAEGARSLLSTVAGAVVTVVGVAFSVTIVSLQLAAAQLGPRVLRNFMRDRGNQFVLGMFVATFVYCLLVLRTIRGSSGLPDDTFVPYLAVTGGVALAIISAGVLIFFIHHAAVGIQADHVIAQIAREIDASMDALYPEDAGQPLEPPSPPPPGFDGDVRVIAAGADGYVESIAVDRILTLADEHDVVVRLVTRPGEFVFEGEPIARAWPARRVQSGVAEAVREAVTLGRERTPLQDFRFGIDQLVEIAVRSVSSGIRDPTTAMRCIDRLGAAVARLGGRRLPSPYRVHEGRLRVIAPGLSFAEVIDGGFGPIRARAAESLSVVVQLLETFERIARLRDVPALHRALLVETVKIECGSREALRQPWEHRIVARHAARVRQALRNDVRDDRHASALTDVA